MADTTARILSGARIADIRKTAEDSPEPHRSNYAALFAEIDRLKALMERARAERTQAADDEDAA